MTFVALKCVVFVPRIFFTEEEAKFCLHAKKKEKKFFIMHSKKHFFAPQHKVVL